MLFELTGTLDDRVVSASGTLGDVSASSRPVALTVRHGESDVSLEGTVETASRPVFRGALRSRHLDLRDGLVEAPASEGARRDRLFGDEPISFDALRGLEAEVDVRIGTLRGPGLALDDVEGKLSLAGDTLAVGPLTARLFDGVFRGEWVLRGDGDVPGIEASFRVDGLDLGRVWRDAGLRQAIEGRATIEASLRGEGGTVRALFADLDGHTTFVAERGRVRGPAIELVAADFVRTFGSWFSKEQDTRIECALSRFEIRDGVAVSRAMLVDTDRIVVAGNGTVDLRTEALDLKLVPRPKEASLVSLGLPILIRGTLTSPIASPDRRVVATKVGGAILGGVLFPPAIVAALGDLGVGDHHACLRAATTGEAVALPTRGGRVGGILRDLGGRIGIRR
jgi:hypothetical protein